jgi:uncharacterized protein YyaL (SSP411 family)
VRRGRLAILAACLLCLACGRTPPPIDDLPGAPPFPAALRERLAAATASPGDTPRTRHRRADGTPRWTNRLVLETSPYLRQHAHDPVDWYPWGEEAFARARAESRPILLSVGYSTCHWCHVMEEESFEDEEIARYLNAHYVAVKVDREVRPDVDDVYMQAVLLMTGRGGWPMTVWLTPSLQPFYGGSYFPAHDGERGIETGFSTLLRALREAFDEQPLRVSDNADALTLRLRAAAAPDTAGELPGAAVLRAAVATLASQYDPQHGGFGRAPKFPSPAALALLLRWHRRTGDPRALAMVTQTLAAMAAGGIHDQLGGGFHRYATDRAWQVPHFEKMLYDNAQLATLYLDAYQATGRADFAHVVRDVLAWMTRDMTAPGGGFFAAVDADSGGDEGAFYRWTPAELDGALEPSQAEVVRAAFGLTDGVLHVAKGPAEVAAALGVAPEAIAVRLAAARSTLRAARARREPPHTDTKVLAAWNGLAIGALARAGAVLGEPAWIDAARGAATFVLDRMRPGGRLRRAFAAGSAGGDAFLDDHAFLAAGLLDLHQATGDPRWLREAAALQETLAAEFADVEQGGFFATAAGQAVPLARQKPAEDDVLPSGNAVAAMSLLRLAELTGDDRWRAQADALLRAFAAPLGRAPARAPALLAALDFRLDRAKEVVVVAPGGHPDAAVPLLDTVHRAYLPNAVVVHATEGPDLARQAAAVPLLAGKRALGGQATAYVCEERVCALPTHDAAALAAQLARVAPLPAAVP